MMTLSEQRKLFSDLVDTKPSYFVQNLADRPGDLRNNFDSLRQSNENLRSQLAVLQARNNELEAYAHTVAHAIKNPLSAIILSSDAIADIADLTPRELRDFTREIRSTAYEMNDLTDNLLLLSELRSLDNLAEPVDMAGTVANAQERLSSLIKEYQGQITSPKTWPSVIGYGPWIEEVWANYISNGLKYGGRPPILELGASIQADGMARFWVSDNGPGLPAKKQTHLFTPFTQVGQVRRSGHGLGLSIVRRIIEKLGGQVGVESKAGQGSLFFFTLPSSQSETSFAADQHLQEHFL